MAQFLSGLGSGATGGAGSPSSALGIYPRAAYAVMSWNNSSIAYESVFLDDQFRRITTTTNLGGYDAWDQTHTGAQQMSIGLPTSGYPTTNATPAWLNATNACGEFGSDPVTVSERGVMSTAVTRFMGQNASRAQIAFVNSDHADRSRVIQFESGWFTSSPLWAPLSYGMFGVSHRSDRKQKSVLALNARLVNMVGSASYNVVRKELVLVCDTTTANVYTAYIWKNLDFNANGVDVSMIPDTPSVTLTVDLTTAGTVATGEAENQQKITPVLCDDGSIYLTAMWPNNYHRLYRAVRNAGDTAVTVALSSSAVLSTTYGRAQGTAYGKRIMQSRDGRSVLSFCPYYYYGAGIAAFNIDKRNATFSPIAVQDSNYGYMPVKYRDDGFAVYYAGNYYASNPQGAYVFNFTYPAPLGTGAPLTGGGQTLYLPIAPGPNTTNYPGLTHVWEYNLQSSMTV